MPRTRGATALLALPSWPPAAMMCLIACLGLIDHPRAINSAASPTMCVARLNTNFDLTASELFALKIKLMHLHDCALVTPVTVCLRISM